MTLFQRRSSGLFASANAIPIVPLALGLGGLIPFWGLAIGLALHGVAGFRPATLDLALVTYAAVILSFLGGMRWGFAARAGDTGMNYVVSVVPSLVAWAWLAAPEPWRLGGLGLTILVLGPIDLQLIRDGLAPPWFGRLRLILSTGAGLALLLGAASYL